ncbi:MAG: alpha-amylase family protein [Pseudomonadota bacterium]
MIPNNPEHPKPDADWTLERLLPRLETRFANRLGKQAWDRTAARVRLNFSSVFNLLYQLYGDQYDFLWHLEEILATALQSLSNRPQNMRDRDVDAEQEKAAGEPWFAGNDQIGAVAYVDRWAGTLADVEARIPYLKQLGVTYLHLMPLLRARQGENDGGYAVSGYREVEPTLGTMADLAKLAETLRGEGLRLCLDFVLNHTADDHDWAERAKQGNGWYQGYYRMYDDRTIPDAYEPNLRQIFPEGGGEVFAWKPTFGKFVWSTFYPYQWDLNFANPALFRQMLEEMLFLANQGVEILRLDAAPFLWKQLGTDCENLPETHALIQAFNALARIAAPSLVFKSEAIVHPDEVARYVGTNEAQLSYFPMLMVLLWEALATRNTGLLRHALQKRFRLPPGTAWVTYLRCHDDIGWGFADEDAAEVGINGYDHRRFLNDFYTGRYPGSFAQGLAFQENLSTGDARISGMAASLCGLGKGGDEDALAVARLVMLHGLILTIGGLPLIYLGDEVARTNDDSYLAEPDKKDDNRWTHRPRTDWRKQQDQLDDPKSPSAKVHDSLLRLIALRKSQPALGGQEMTVVNLQNPHVFGFQRGADKERLLVLANMTERDQAVADASLLDTFGTESITNLVDGRTLHFGAQGLVLTPYQLLITPITSEQAASHSD